MNDLTPEQLERVVPILGGTGGTNVTLTDRIAGGATFETLAGAVADLLQCAAGTAFRDFEDKLIACAWVKEGGAPMRGFKVIHELHSWKRADNDYGFAIRFEAIATEFDSSKTER